LRQEIKAISRPEHLTAILRALHVVPDLPGITMSTVRAPARRHPPIGDQDFDEVDLVKLEIVVPSPSRPTPLRRSSTPPTRDG